MGLRQVIDDARRAQFVILLVVGAMAAAVTGTYWGWWAFVWGLGLPVRVLGVVAISATAFVCWYGLLFTGYHYFGVPKRNPLVGPRLESEVETPNLQLTLRGGWDGGETYRIAVSNEGQTDTFAGEITYIAAYHGSVNYPPMPMMMRWGGTDAEKREIVKGHTNQLEVFRFERAVMGNAVSHRPIGRFSLLIPGTEIDFLSGLQEYLELNVSFKLTSVTSGKADRFSLDLAVTSAAMVRTSAVLRRDDNSCYSIG